LTDHHSSPARPSFEVVHVLLVLILAGLVLGAMSLSFLNPAGVPVVGLAFAAVAPPQLSKL
jgi:hypothetical protein